MLRDPAAGIYAFLQHLGTPCPRVLLCGPLPAHPVLRTDLGGPTGALVSSSRGVRTPSPCRGSQTSAPRKTRMLGSYGAPALRRTGPTPDRLRTALRADHPLVRARAGHAPGPAAVPSRPRRVRPECSVLTELQPPRVPPARARNPLVCFILLRPRPTSRVSAGPGPPPARSHRIAKYSLTQENLLFSRTLSARRMAYVGRAKDGCRRQPVW